MKNTDLHDRILLSKSLTEKIKKISNRKLEKKNVVHLFGAA